MKLQLLTAFALGLGFVPGACAGEIVGYVPGGANSKATYDRFLSGFPSAPITNTSPLFVGNGLDLSGIGWRATGNWGITLVSPRHFVTAAHVGGYTVGEEVRFLGTDGVVHSYTVAGQIVAGQTVARQTVLTTTFTNSEGASQSLPSDILVVTLSAPIPGTDTVTPLAVGVGTAPAGTNLLAYGQNPIYGADTRHLGTNTLDRIELASFNSFSTEATRVAVYDFTRDRPGEIALIGGDSGGALLTGVNGQAVLLGTHYGVDGNLNDPDSPYLSASAYLPDYLGQLKVIVESDGQSLNLVPVPEPATVGLFAATAAVFALRLRRWRHRKPASIHGAP